MERVGSAKARSSSVEGIGFPVSYSRLIRIGILLLTCALVAPRLALAHATIDSQLEEVTQLIAKNPGDARLFLRRGELHRVHTDWSAAEADYRTARQIDPGLAEVDFCLGRMFLEKGQPEKALPELDKFLARKPEEAECLTLRARALALLGRTNEAVKDYRRALASLAARGADDPNTFLELSNLLTAGDSPRREEALE